LCEYPKGEAKLPTYRPVHRARNPRMDRQMLPGTGVSLGWLGQKQKVPSPSLSAAVHFEERGAR